MASFFLKELLMELLQNQNHLEESQLELLNSIYLKREKNIYSSHFVITVTFTSANINLSEQKQAIIPTWPWQTHSPYYPCCHLPSFFPFFLFYLLLFFVF